MIVYCIKGGVGGRDEWRGGVGRNCTAVDRLKDCLLLFEPYSVSKRVFSPYGIGISKFNWDILESSSNYVEIFTENFNEGVKMGQWRANKRSNEGHLNSFSKNIFGEEIFFLRLHRLWKKITLLSIYTTIWQSSHDFLQ